MATFTIKDLATQLSVNPRKLRRSLRRLARENPRLRRSIQGVPYTWSKRDLAIAAKALTRDAEERATECDPRCTSSISEDCSCHCGGVNHGIHAGS